MNNRKTKKSVVISGYYGFDNLGDEAVLYSMLQALDRELPGLEVTVLSHNPAATAGDYGVRAVNRWHPGEVARALRQSQLLISGGGSLLQDVTGLKSLLYYLGVIRLARLLGRPVFYYAQGIGPLYTPLGRRLVAMTTRGAQVVTVRDEESRRDLLALGLKKPVQVTADPVLGIHPGAIELAVGAQILQRYTSASVTPGSRVVGVSVRQIPGPAGWETELARALDILVKEGLGVVFVPMQNPADVEVSRRVARAMEKPGVVVDEKLTVPAMLSLVGNLDILVGMRLHALIFAAVCSVPPVGIVYDPKVERFLGRIHVTPAGSPGELRAGALAAQVKEFLAHRQEVRERMGTRVEELRQAARRTAALVGKQLPKDRGS